MFYRFIASMKKYFLLITLFSLVFLWLGKLSVVEAWPVCTSTPSTVPWNTYTCEYLDPPPAKCNGLWQTCDGTKDCAGGTQCCICNPAPAPVIPVTWWSSSTSISCPDINWVHYKKVGTGCKPCSDPNVCCGISLNTSIPFIGNCIEDGTSAPGPGETSVTWTTAFPVLMWSLTKILVTLILIISFVLIIIWGIMIATGNPSWGKKMIMNVVVGIALLWASWVILRLINPNFFG